MRRLLVVLLFVFVLLHLYRAADDFLRTESPEFVVSVIRFVFGTYFPGGGEFASHVLLNKRSVFGNGICCANGAFHLLFGCVSIPCLVPRPLHDRHVFPAACPATSPKRSRNSPVRRRVNLQAASRRWMTASTSSQPIGVGNALAR